MSRLEFMENLYKQLQIFQICYVLKIYPQGFKRTSENLSGLFIIPANLVRENINHNADPLKVGSINEYIKSYSINLGGRFYPNIEPEDIWRIEMASLNDLLKPINRMDTLASSLHNIKMANKAKGVILDRNGFMGFFSNKVLSKDYPIALPFDSEEQSKFQKFLDNFGFKHNDSQFALTNLPLDYHKIDFNINSLQINEGLEYELKTISDVYNFDMLLLNQIKGSTYSNKTQAEKAFYQNNVIPTSKLIAESIKNEFDLKEKVYFDFSHLAVLQDDLLKKATTNQKQVATILQINQSIANGELTYEVAVAMLENILAIDNETASKLLIRNVKAEK